MRFGHVENLPGEGGTKDAAENFNGFLGRLYGYGLT